MNNLLITLKKARSTTNAVLLAFVCNFYLFDNETQNLDSVAVSCNGNVNAVCNSCGSNGVAVMLLNDSAVNRVNLYALGIVGINDCSIVC